MSSKKSVVCGVDNFFIRRLCAWWAWTAFFDGSEVFDLNENFEFDVFVWLDVSKVDGNNGLQCLFVAWRRTWIECFA